MSRNKKEIGEIGEKIAKKWLEDRRYKILDKNYFEKSLSGKVQGEIDIVAKKGNVIHFLEVKTDNLISTLFQPEQRVNLNKKRKLAKIAQSWLIRNKIPLTASWQIDVISVKMDLNSKKAKIRHLENIN